MSIELGSGQVLYEVENLVATAVINREERRNAISPDVVAGLREAVSRTKKDPEARVLVISGAGEKAFCAGADLSVMFTTPPPGRNGGPAGGSAEGAEARASGAGSAPAGDPAGGYEDVLGAHEGRGDIARLFQEMWGMGKPSIAKVQGWALAGGFGLAMACDMVIASEKARFGAPEIGVGLWPFIISVPLVRSMPPKVALELMMTGRFVGAEEARSLGFVNRVVAHEELGTAVNEAAAALAGCSPLVMRLGKTSFYDIQGMRPEDAFAHLQALLTLTTMTADAAEGIAAFLEKREPVWTGR